MLVLGVDPGSRITGYGLIEKKNNHMTCVHAGHISSSSKLPFYERIHGIFKSIVEIIDNYQPQEMAIEDMFYARNVKSSLKLGHARGAVLIAAAQAGIKIYEYTPLEIKKAVVGYGRASKEQVGAMVKVILKLEADFGFDTTDALATAICHLNWSKFDSLIKRKKPGGK